MLHARTLLEIVDGEFDDGVVTMEGVEVDGSTLEVGQEGEVAPVGPQRGLGADQAGAAHDEAPALVGALGHLGPPSFGVVDLHPGVLGDGGDGPGQGLGPGAHGHRVVDPETPEGLRSSRSTKTPSQSA